jgi:hypothetical protein
MNYVSVDRITIVVLVASALVGIVASRRWRWMRFTVAGFVIASLAIVDGWRGDWLAASVAALIVAVCVFRDLQRAKVVETQEPGGE